MKDVLKGISSISDFHDFTDIWRLICVNLTSHKAVRGDRRCSGIIRAETYVSEALLARCFLYAINSDTVGSLRCRLRPCHGRHGLLSSGPPVLTGAGASTGTAPADSIFRELLGLGCCPPSSSEDSAKDWLRMTQSSSPRLGRDYKME